MIIINPHDLHRTSSTEVQEFERILINFSHDFIEPLLKCSHYRLLPFPENQNFIAFSLREQAAVEHMLMEMKKECKLKKKDTRMSSGRCCFSCFSPFTGALRAAAAIKHGRFTRWMKKSRKSLHISIAAFKKR